MCLIFIFQTLGSGEQNHGDDPAYSQMYHPSYSGGPGFSNQSSYGLPGSSRLSYGATDGSEIFDPGQGSSHMDGDGMEPPGGFAFFFKTRETHATRLFLEIRINQIISIFILWKSKMEHHFRSIVNWVMKPDASI